MAEEDKCYKGSRYTLIFFNIVFFVFGVTLLGLGIYAKVHSTKYDDYLTVIDKNNSTWENFGALCIATGIICMVLGFSGLIGVFRNSKGCLIFFLVVVVLIFILELVGGGLAIGFQNKIKDDARVGMYKTLPKFDNNTSSAITKSWDEVQQDLACCGVANYTDWAAKNNHYSEGEYPDSCVCQSESDCGSVLYREVFPNGCYDGVVNKVEGSWKAWGGALIGFAVFELVGIIAGIIVLKNAGKAGYYLA